MGFLFFWPLDIAYQICIIYIRYSQYSWKKHNQYLKDFEDGKVTKLIPDHEWQKINKFLTIKFMRDMIIFLLSAPDRILMAYGSSVGSWIGFH